MQFVEARDNLKNKTKQPRPQSAEEIVVVCNGTGGCSVPGLDGIVDKTISDLDGLIKSAETQKARAGKIIDIFAESPVLYIQRLKRWFQDHANLGSDPARTRVKRSVANGTTARGREKHEDSVTISNLPVPPSLVNVSDVDHSVSPKPRSIRKKRDTSKFEKPRGSSKKVKMSFLNNHDFEEISPNKSLLIPSISRSDVDVDFESQPRYIKIRHVRRRPHQTAELTRPANVPTKRIWDDEGFNQQLLLGGSVRDFSTGDQSDPSNSFQILDADHDYDADYEYMKMSEPKGSEENHSSSGGSSENRPSFEEERSTGGKGEEGSQQEGSVEEVSKEGEEREELSREGEEDNGGEVENGDEEENTEEEEDVEKTKIVILQPTTSKDNAKPQFGVSSEDIQARYITKDPLAGPGATRGFNHDFKAARGVPIQGGVAVLPTRYPTVPGFNTKQIHNILTTGKLPGTVGAGPNGTSVGIIPIEPARNARPNNLGQYLEELQPPKYPGRGGQPRRPVGRVRIKSVYKGRPRVPVYGRGPVRGQHIAYRNRPQVYRHPIRGGSHLSYLGRGNPAKVYRSRSSGPVVRINILEKRAFEEQPENKDGSALTSSQSASYSSEGQKNKPPDNRNRETANFSKAVSDSKTNSGYEEEENKREEINRVKNNSRLKSDSRKDQNENSNENVHNTVNKQNEYKRIKVKEGLKSGDRKIIRKKNRPVLKDDKVNGKTETDSEILLPPKSEGIVEESELVDDEDDIPRTVAKIMQRTKQLENEKLTADGKEPVAYNKYWSLEYSYPT